MTQRRRVKVEIRWNPDVARFEPYLDGERVHPHWGLCYGDTPAARAGTGDDPAESVKTIDRSDPERPTNAIDAVCVGWTSIPNGD